MSTQATDSPSSREPAPSAEKRPRRAAVALVLVAVLASIATSMAPNWVDSVEAHSPDALLEPAEEARFPLRAGAVEQAIAQAAISLALTGEAEVQAHDAPPNVLARLVDPETEETLRDGVRFEAPEVAGGTRPARRSLTICSLPGDSFDDEGFCDRHLEVVVSNFGDAPVRVRWRAELFLEAFIGEDEVPPDTPMRLEIDEAEVRPAGESSGDDGEDLGGGDDAD